MTSIPKRAALRPVLAWAVLSAFSAGVAAARQKPAPAAAATPSPPGYAKVEFGLWGGGVRARTLGSTAYQDAWSTFLGTSVAERTSINVRTSGIPVYGASLAFFFHSHTGIQVLAGYAQSRTSGPARMDFDWTLADGSLDRRSSVPPVAKGRMTSFPLCLNFIERLVIGRWSFEASAGPVYYLHEFNQDSAFGYSVVGTDPVAGRPDLPPVESYDALTIPLKIPKTSWNAWGADLGAGLHVRIAPFLAAAAEARYFHCPEKTLSWTPQPGSYDGMFTSGFPAEPFGAAEISDLAAAGQTFSLKVNPSFFQISVGVLLTFGR